MIEKDKKEKEKSAKKEIDDATSEEVDEPQSNNENMNNKNIGWSKETIKNMFETFADSAIKTFTHNNLPIRLNLNKNASKEEIDDAFSKVFSEKDVLKLQSCQIFLKRGLLSFSFA